jgi:hypothetical protein
VAIRWTAKMISYSFKKWTLQHAKHASRSDEDYFKEEKKQKTIVLFLSLGVLFQGIVAFF